MSIDATTEAGARSMTPEQLCLEENARFNAHDIAGIRQIFSPTDSEWAQWERSLRALFRAFPDIRRDIDRLVVQGSTVAMFCTVTGTHAEEFPVAELAGIAGTGRVLTWKEAHVREVVDGEVVDGDLVVGIERLRQLGGLPQWTDFPPE